LGFLGCGGKRGKNSTVPESRLVKGRGSLKNTERGGGEKGKKDLEEDNETGGNP